MGGFILGLDGDGEGVFDAQIEFIQRAGIPMAMVGLLTALRETNLYHRLKRENRLREDVTEMGDRGVINLTGVNSTVNFEPEMEIRTLLEGYRRVITSFWSRLGEGRLGIGLLSDTAARAALAEPLAAHGEGIDADALATVVEDSQRYPYFIQLWGEALWEGRPATGATRLTAAHTAAARPYVAARVTDYYEDRYLELDQSGWLAVAERVAARFQSGPTLTYEELKSAVAAGLAASADTGQVHAALDALQRLGFVWRPPGQLPPVRYKPGIPSLMEHVLDHAAPAPAGAS